MVLIGRRLVEMMEIGRIITEKVMIGRLMMGSMIIRCWTMKITILGTMTKSMMIKVRKAMYHGQVRLNFG